jgi:hypothetical protein
MHRYLRLARAEFGKAICSLTAGISEHLSDESTIRLLATLATILLWPTDIASVAAPSWVGLGKINAPQ